MISSSNSMIVNSHPYNPSQQSQQQRCIGLNQDSNMNNQANRSSNMFNSLTSSQQNSLYAPFTSSSSSGASNRFNQQQQQSHMLDLANLQQSVFESNFESNNNKTTPESQPSRGAANKQQPEVSLYSPSSSTSLLYHIYDQINLPNEQQYQQTPSNMKKSNTTTILNPANLFNNNNQQQQQQLPLQMQLHQQQLSSDFNKMAYQQQQQQQCYSTMTNSQYHHQLQQQQPQFTTLHHHQSAYNQSNQLMLDTVMRQHHANTTTRQRPLSTSGSTVSGQSPMPLPITYGRQLRSGTNTVGNGKSQSNLVSVLQSSNTLNHLGIAGSNGGQTGKSGPGYFFNPMGFKRANQRARHFLYEYRTIVNCSILLILLAFSLMTIIKFTLLNATPSTSSNYHHQLAVISSQLDNSNTLLYPPFTKQQQQQQQQQPHILDHQQPAFGAPQPDVEEEPVEAKQPLPSQQQQQQHQQDVLKSKLVIGEFVILTQNYSHLPAQKSLLAERIVKLMDQVFLATDVRRVYSRMEVTNIRANRPSGIVVDCNIILSESIAYAAQQFGIALYDSLAKSHERLANQANYVVDKNSIRFNTVPDKDLKSGIVPPGLIPPSVSLELAFPTTSSATDAFAAARPVAPSVISPATDRLASSDNMDQMNPVVWSEWSNWSSCVDKNGICDPTRLHSRLRECRAQHTGEKVEASQCKQRFNLQDQELEVADCIRTCSQQDSAAHIMSDAPSVVGPQTAPSVLVSGGSSDPPAFLSKQASNKMSALSAASSAAQQSAANKDPANLLADLYTPSSSSPPASSSVEQMMSTERTMNDISSSAAPQPVTSQQVILTTPILQQEQLSCSNCTSDEICLLLMSQKVPFCAKMKDRSDESGCGGWCKAQNQLCQPVGQNAFKCIHDSECLAEEWRCFDSACIPLSKRCDGHSNCYDNSDERDCPI